MATSGDPKRKELADEADCGNKVHPAGVEKSKRKSLFGRASKSESKPEGKQEKKDKAKEESVQKKTAKDKKSEKTESKKEGTPFLLVYTFAQHIQPKTSYTCCKLSIYRLVATC